MTSAFEYNTMFFSKATDYLVNVCEVHKWLKPRETGSNIKHYSGWPFCLAITLVFTCGILWFWDLKQRHRKITQLMLFASTHQYKYVVI